LLLGATLPPPIVALPPPVVVLASPPLVLFAPPAVAIFISPPSLAVASISPGWWHAGFVTDDFLAVGATTTVAHFGDRGFAEGTVGFHDRTADPSHWAEGGRQRPLPGRTLAAEVHRAIRQRSFRENTFQRKHRFVKWGSGPG
jgi:hypothetical protein